MRGKRLLLVAWSASLAVFVLALFTYLGSGNDVHPSEPRFSRTQLELEILGSNTDHVIDVVGHPKSTSEGSMERYWYFDRLTRDDTTGKVDRSVQVVFKDDLVVSLNYQQ